MPALMLQGTGSDVGKSLLVAGLARLFSRRGLRVRPFKPQNMANNAAVTADGGEIGRAQALQARACGVPPHTDMNPVLLKPQSDIGAQVVVQGTMQGEARAREYQSLKPYLLGKVLESFERLRRQADLILVEGAGSAAEVNLRAGDIANMGFASAAGVPVVLVADIDRGGVIASVVGTHALLDDTDRALIRGYLINKFRGDVSLFDEGLAVIGARTGLASYGVVPWFEHARRLPAEDGMALEEPRPARAYGPADAAVINVAVPRLPRIANFDDLDPLIAEPGVAVRFLELSQALPGDTHVVVLPGSKSTVSDLWALEQAGWFVDLTAHVRRGGWLVGLCAGYQMMGHRVADPHGIEGTQREQRGLGLLDVITQLEPRKRLRERSGLELATAQPVYGYEMHIGVTEGPGTARPMLALDGQDRDHGVRSADGKVMGCYLHGLFASDGFRRHFLNAIRRRDVQGIQYEKQVDATLDELASHLQQHVQVDALLALARSCQR